MEHKPFKIARQRKRKRGNLIMLGLAISLFVGGGFFVWASTLQIPDLNSFGQRRVFESTKIYDRTGEILLYDVNQDIKRTSIPFENISRNVKNAAIAIEDKGFYSHGGVELKSLIRAVLVNTSSLEFSQGGSTITQQVVKNSLLTNEKKISRKIKEWVLAIKLEGVLTKDQILATYLNEIPYGGAVYGIEEASKTFFGKTATELTLAESAYLASLPKAPTFYSPYGVNRDALENRKNLVLKEMLNNGFITDKEYQTALKEVVSFKPREVSGIKAPHFVFFVLDYLEKKYGVDMIQTGGLQVKTTLDYGLEQKGEEIARKNALTNKDKFNAENAAFTAIDPKTGQILVMVGSRDYFDKEIDGNFNIATSPNRQPGSTFKPFVYSQAFIKGYTPETVLFDVRTQFSTNCAADNLTSENGCYSPNNYDLNFHGPITFRDALAQSVNIPSVKVMYLAGIGDSLSLARNMGITTLKNSNQYGLTLVLGGGEVSLLEMTSAYGIFANQGVKNSYAAVLEVVDKNGKILESYKNNPTQVLDREVAGKISDILSDNVARAPAFGQSSQLYFPNRDVAVKTGTTNDFRDAWIIGYTPSLVLGAWAGNNDNSPMEKKVAGFIVAPMWREFMDEILTTLPDEKLPHPQKEDSFDLKPRLRGKWQGGASVFIDNVSGKIATEHTPKETVSEFLSGGVHSILFWVDKNNPRGPVPSNPENDPQFFLWEEGVARWRSQTSYTPTPPPTLPTEFDDVHVPGNFPQVRIISSNAGLGASRNAPVSISISIQSKYPINKVEYFVNGGLVGESQNPLVPFVLSTEDISTLPDNNSLRVVVTDSIFNRGESTTNLSLSN
ncbi:MAG: hypothetical protein COV95_00800 [Candidatus Zambryskibacteria bacterium CG11_big_fil_rev_8_21_14_0_20_40_24]|uniref:Uncharacterized protein n=1 Tax=Candidatus Zambryskibacteria bacterium CG11_big_fil_rev_8_21_14_0_20_40_24 TaxID=1975116 RepID=A0A2H0K9K4_9BACT|nr:MAG: hypothetical protein COV95_00800 [Candidatus Zambryskibacteria bacterium CG11_big_fil_rev_8_21_14_0_20_40_24]